MREPDALVLDPPRTGIPDEAFDAIADLRARRIVYLSCDPATLARDLARLRSNAYRLDHVEGFDLFPQTPHVESLATMTRVEPD
jgi:23S rRNA (uracil1939-C5)-methyltransferase